MKNLISNFFKTNPETPDGISSFRLYLMRALYLLNFFFGVYLWPMIIRQEVMSDPLQAVAFSFWAALFTLSGLGIPYPLKMLPLLFMQLFYKSVWLMAFGLSLSAEHSSSLTNGMIIGIVLDLIVIPWPYVLANYVKMRGDRWR
jgi:hypothetical protein